MAPKTSFYAQWQSTHVRRAWLTPVNILKGTMLITVVLMVVQFMLLRDTPIIEEPFSWSEHSIDAYNQVIFPENHEVYPEMVLNSKWAAPVPREDRLHLALLHEACITHKNALITSAYAKGGVVTPDNTHAGVIQRDDPDLFDKISQCADVDIYLPEGIRGHGYCEDAAGYTKYMEARMLPAWAIETIYTDKKSGKRYTYYDLCPKTPMVFFNHYWDGVPARPEYPKNKPTWFMPNIEMFELNPKHFWSVDAVLCKTATCARRARWWYKQEGNPKNTVVFYTRHTTSDIAVLARERLGEAKIKPKNFSDVHFIHVAGASTHKGTKYVLECWFKRPDLPHIDVFVSKATFDAEFKPFEKELETVKDRVTVHFERVDPTEFGKRTAEEAFFVCTSDQEGYGHYINQPRAAGAVIITSDMPPMNELITPESGVLMPVERWSVDGLILGGKYRWKHGLRGVQGITAMMDADRVCASIDRVIAMAPEERKKLGDRAKLQYNIDTNVFAANMKEVQAYARGSRRVLRTPAP